MKIQRLFIPGSEWLYLKVYLGQQISDTILVNNVAPLLRQLQEKQIVEKFFFIRYVDMSFHLRIRLKLFKADDVGYVIDRIYNEFVQLMGTGLVWNLQYGSYQRELERYGETTMELAESIFFEDSEIVLNILKRAENKIYVSWIIVDQYFSFIYPSIQKKQLFCKEMSISYLKKFDLDNSYDLRQFNPKYRTYKDWMLSSLDSHNDQSHQQPCGDIVLLLREILIGRKSHFLVGFL